MGREVTDVGFVPTTEKRELKKHAATIHCSNSLSLLQRKVSNALLYHAYRELMTKDEHEITIKQLCLLIGYHGNNHGVIKDALRGLISTVIEWNLIDDKTGNENWTASSILASVSLEGPLCYFAYSPRMKQLLHSPSMFGKIDLVIQSRFRSSYGLALYENCVRYRGLPYTKWFEIDLFKKLMGVHPGTYDIFRDFKKRVLDKAIDEVNMYSDVTITPEYQKNGRKVAMVRFGIKCRAKRTRLGDRQQGNAGGEGVIKTSTLKETLISKFGLSNAQADDILAENKEDYILDKIKIIGESRAFKAGQIKNIAAYLISAIKKDYQLPKDKLTNIVTIDNARAEIEIGDMKRVVKKIHSQYQAYREGVIDEIIEALPDLEKEKFMEEFTAFSEPVITNILSLSGKKYNHESILGMAQVRGLLRNFALREIKGIEIATIEEFVANLDESQQSAWRKLKAYDPDQVLLR